MPNNSEKVMPINSESDRRPRAGWVFLSNWARLLRRMATLGWSSPKLALSMASVL
jgi:hypothetical protein